MEPSPQQDFEAAQHLQQQQGLPVGPPPGYYEQQQHSTMPQQQMYNADGTPASTTSYMPQYQQGYPVCTCWMAPIKIVGTIPALPYNGMKSMPLNLSILRRKIIHDHSLAPLLHALRHLSCGTCLQARAPQDMYMSAPYGYPPPPPLYRAEESSSSGLPWWLILGIGIALGGLLGKVRGLGAVHCSELLSAQISLCSRLSPSQFHLPLTKLHSQVQEFMKNPKSPQQMMTEMVREEARLL